MTPDFSEFSYGFAFTHEYINRNPGLRVAPELPSLINEAETGHCQERFFLVGVQGKSVHRKPAVFHRRVVKTIACPAHGGLQSKPFQKTPILRGAVLAAPI